MLSVCSAGVCVECLCVLLSMCACVKEREREREGGSLVRGN